MKKLLLSTMLMATCTGGFSETVWSKTLTGQSDWMVRKVSADTPYCTVARQFDANAVLTMAKNAKGEGTIALDFQRSAFDITRPYPVVLQVGGVAREYAVKPAVANVIILRVGSDVALFQAMEMNNVLNVTIDEETFSMDLSGYGSAYSDLNNCLGVKPQPQQIANAPLSASTMVPAVPRQMSVEQTTRIESLLAENKRLTQELVSRDQQQQQFLKQDANKASAETEQLVQKLIVSEQKNAQLLSQIEKLEIDLKTSRQSLNPDMGKAIQERDEQISRLTKQNQSLKVALDEATERLASVTSSSSEISVEMREQLAQLQTQAAVFKAERDEYQKQLSVQSSSSSQEVNALQSRVVQLENQITESNAARDSFQKQLQNSSNTVSAESNELRAQVARMEEQIAAYKAERDEYQRQLASQTSNASQETVALQGRVTQLQNQISESNAARDEYKKQLQNSSETSDAVSDQLRSKLTEMENQIAAYKAERDQYQSQLQQKTKEMAQLQNREPEIIVKEVIKEVPQIRPDMLSSDSDIALRLSEAKTEAQTFKAERDEYRRILQQERSKERSDSSSADNVNMISEIQKLESEKADLARQLAYAKSAAQTEPTNNSAAQAEIQRLTNDLSQAQARITDMETSTASASGNAENNAMLQARLKDMEVKLTAMTLEKSVLQDKLNASQLNKSNNSTQKSQQEATMQARLLDMEEMVNRANIEKDRLSAQLENTRRTLNEKQEQSQEYEVVVARLQDMENKVQRMNQEKAIIEGKLNAAQAVKNDGSRSQEDEMNALRLRMNELQSQVSLLDQEKAALNQDLNAAKSASALNAAEKDKIAQAAKRLQDMENRLLTMTRENATLQNEVQIAQQKAQDATRKLAQAAVQQLDAEDTLKTKQEMVKMRAEIAALKKQNVDLMEDVVVTQKSLQTASSPAETEALKKQLLMAQQNAEAARVKLAQVQVSQLAENNNQSRQQLKTLQAEIAALEAQNTVLRKDVSQYKQSATDQAKMAMFQSQQQVRLAVAPQPQVAVQPQMPAVETQLQPAPQPQKVNAEEQRRRSLPVLDTQIQRQALASQILQQSQVQPVQARPAAPVTAAAIAPQVIQAAQQARPVLSGNEIKTIVSRAKLPLVANVDRIDHVSGPDFAAFRWDTGVVYGSGEQSRIGNISGFNNTVQNYINKTKSRCTGSFDQTLTDRSIDGVNVKVADIACVDENANGVAASILFFIHQGMFYALAHEADMNTFETAMDMRDRLANSIGAIF